MMHVTVAGPIKNPLANRTCKHGSLSVSGRCLNIRLTDGRTIRVALESSAAIRHLAAVLMDEARSVQLTETTMATLPVEEFISDRVLPVQDREDGANDQGDDRADHRAP